MSGGNSAYSPLPQSNSDTDESSEEELHSSHESRVINRIPKPPNPKPEIILNGQRQKITNYKPLDNDRDIGITLNGFQTNEVSILKPENSNKLSTPRRIFFVSSIFLCVLMIFVFLWILPCDVGSCLPAATSSSWEKVIFDKEIRGPINVLPGAKGESQNLVFLLISSFDGDYEQSPDRGGVISLLGKNGNDAWLLKLKRQPKDIDCNLIDINGDGSNDCLVVGSDNLLKAVEPITGVEIWDVSYNTKEKPYDMDFPIVLPDLDGDDVNELLTSCSINSPKNSTSRKQNHLIIISGKTGSVIGDPFKIDDCSEIHNLMAEGLNISFACIKYSQKESFRTIRLSELYEKVKKVKLQLNFKSKSSISQHKANSPAINTFNVNGRRLILDNQGRCPEKCEVHVTVRDEREGKRNYTIWNYSGESTYGTIPVTITFGKLSGFVLKFWQWHPKKGSRNIPDRFANFTNTDVNMEGIPSEIPAQKIENDLKSEKKKRKRKKLPKSGEQLEADMFVNGVSNSVRDKRTSELLLQEYLKRSKKSSPTAINLSTHHVSERVVLITFNETDSHVVNASQVEIIQLCKSPQSCQPDLYSQTRSLLITDLDQDGSHELISYTSTFVMDDGTDRQLQSRVRVLRLEAEIPKLYEAVMRP